MRQARFRLTVATDPRAERGTRSDRRVRTAGGTALWVMVAAAGLYWLSGARNGPIWPVPAPPVRSIVRVAPTLDLGSQPVGTPGTVQHTSIDVVAAENGVPLTVQPATVSGPQSDSFVIAEDGCAGERLSSGDACAVGVRFNPRGQGPQNAVLVVPTSLAAPPFQIELQGIGLPPQVGSTVPQIVVQTDIAVHPHVKPPLPPLAVGGRVVEAVPIYDPPPIYPEQARVNRMEGVVVLTAVIGADGSLSEIHVVQGDPVLAGAAAEAVSHWRYRPTELNGKPISDRITITFKFALTQPAGTP